MLDTMLIEYEDTLINRLPEVRSDNFYGKKQTYANQTRALSCIRYAIEEILQWDADKAINKFDAYMLKCMKLTKIADYIDYPDEVSKRDPRYILSLLYPQKVKLDHERLVSEVFQRVLRHEDKQFPRDYFSGGIGFNRFCYCVKYIIENNLVIDNIPEIYDFFSSLKGKNILLEHRLRTPAYQYAIDLYAVIYTITREYEDAELWYCYYCFKRAMKRVGQDNSAETQQEDGQDQLELDFQDPIEEPDESDDVSDLDDGDDINDLSEDELKAKLQELDCDIDPDDFPDELSDEISDELLDDLFGELPED